MTNSTLVPDRVDFPFGTPPLLWCSDCRAFIGAAKERARLRLLCASCELEHDREKVRRYRARKRAAA